MRMFSLYLPDQQIGALRELADQTGVPVARYIRLAIADFLDSQVPCGVVCSGSITSGYLLVVKGR
mgnify:CR=1 FL=1